MIRFPGKDENKLQWMIVLKGEGKQNQDAISISVKIKFYL